MTKELTNPRIYVACLASYNNGVLHGAWIDAEQSADDIHAEVAEMLRGSKYPNVQVDCPECKGRGEMRVGLNDCDECAGTGKVASAEEWAIHDFEGFGGIKISEHESFETVAELAEALEEHGEAFAVFYGNDARGSVRAQAFRSLNMASAY